MLPEVRVTMNLMFICFLNVKIVSRNKITIVSIKFIWTDAFVLNGKKSTIKLYKSIHIKMMIKIIWIPLPIFFDKYDVGAHVHFFTCTKCHANKNDPMDKKWLQFENYINLLFVSICLVQKSKSENLKNIQSQKHIFTHQKMISLVHYWMCRHSNDKWIHR